jgi:hypothetical protein
VWIPLALAITVALDPSPALSGNCAPTRVHFTGHIASDGPAKVTYTWVRVNQPPGRTYTLDFPQAATLPVTYDLLVRKSEQGWVALRVILPQQKDSAKVQFEVKCK